MLNNKVDVLPGFYHQETVLVDMVKNRNGTFNVLFLDTESIRSKSILRLKVYSETGDELLESSTEFDEEVRIHSGTTNQLKGPDMVIMGTYGRKKNSKLSQGFYFIKVRPGVNDNVRFTEFTEMQNLWKFMGENRERRIKAKIEESGKNKPFEYKATVIVWKLDEIEDHYVVFSEMVDPDYQTTQHRVYNYYGYSGSPFYNDPDFNSNDSRYYSKTNSLVNKDLMISVKYDESFMAVFDKAGRVLADRSKEIEDIETRYLDQISAFDAQENDWQIMYKDEEELFVSSGTLLSNDQQDSVVTINSLDPLDNIRRDTDDTGRVEHWYDNHYFVWGYQRIQNAATNDNRHVFYINKITM